MSVFDISGNPIYTEYGMTGSVLSDCYDIDGDSLKSTPDLTVMTFNPQGWTGINSQSSLLTALISKYDPDIVGVQESGWSNSWPSASQPFINGFDYKQRSPYTEQASGNSGGTVALVNPNGLLSKIAWSNLTETEFSVYSGNPYAYTKCYLTISGKTVAWYNTHLSWEGDSYGQERRRQQIIELIEDVEQEDYAILTGDWNVWGTSMSSADYTNVYKPFADLGYKMVNFDRANHCIATWGDATAPTSLADLTDGCDNIIVSPNIDFIDVWFDDTKLSYLDGSNAIDHIPVVATIKVN